MEIKKFKIITTKEDDKDSDTLLFIDGFDNAFLEDKIALNQMSYKNLFGKTFKKSSYKPWKKGIVKIVNKTKDKTFTLYRIYLGANLKEDTIGLLKYNKDILGLDNTSNIIIKKGSRFLFYWNHPNHTVRSAFKLGFLSLSLTIISLLIGIVTIIIGTR